MSDSPPAGKACQYSRFFSGQVCASAAGAAASARTARSLFMAVLLNCRASVPEKPLPPGARFPLVRNPDAREETSAFAREQLEGAAVPAPHALDDGEAQARAALAAARDF